MITFHYKNHRGEVAERHVEVDSLEFVTNPGFGYQPGWFLSGHDLDKGARRSFALSHIQSGDTDFVGRGQGFHMPLMDRNLPAERL